jgi:hypothetical protein
MKSRRARSVRLRTGFCEAHHEAIEWRLLVDEGEFAVHSSRQMRRRITGIALTALLAMTQASPLMAAVCGTKAMDCCDGVMCPIPKKPANGSHESMQHCAPGAMDESATTCKASPCAPKSSPAIHASMYLLPAAAELTRERIVESAAQSFELISSAMSAVPDPPPPKIIFS